MRKETAILSQHVDWLVRQAEEFGTHVVNALRKTSNPQQGGQANNKPNNRKDPAGEFGKSQIENLLAAMNHITSLEELKLFVRYQIGRDDKRNGWARVGDRFLAILDEIQRRGEHDVSEPRSRQQLQHEMVERFLLYWKWQHTYLVHRIPEGTHPSPAQQRRNAR
ncbi:hypothetical protein CVV65_13450 [Kyrpidia spormannii]|uniref:Uncharacterized protein n=1 Tax=Kyrpidia spormannii TaxID=2055160 RepID=A0A2K8N8X4_9BACL|nr:hypothetical protein [Kyrpidia spormannii]ATY85806.1 hypothetical protein CVV65_13450 [Kyrpidia spormannii]